MKAVLDHVGIAVGDLAAATAFYRDVLGLEVGTSEDVASQQVRAHVVRAGAAAVELLEATAPGSAIARYLERRGPGLHHITFRVADLDEALARLRARGVRLIDEVPRPGAGGTRVAFVHPSAAHGVLVELAEPAATGPTLGVRTLPFGDLQLTAVHDGPFRLDGGAMFGIVPKVLWEAQAPADDRNRIQLAMRPLLVEAAWGRLLVDCGAGDKMSAKQQEIYGLDRSCALDQALGERGLSPAAIDVVLATHLHFDHFGGATARAGDRLVPRFPNAEYVIRAGEWEDATHPHARNRASYLADDFVPLLAAGVVTFHSGDEEIRPGVRVVRTGGHTGQHQIVFVESDGRTAVFVADLIPTTAHLAEAWIMGYDLFPMETLAFKQRFIREAIEREYLILFEHDPHVAAGYVRNRGGKLVVEQVL